MSEAAEAVVEQNITDNALVEDILEKRIIEIEKKLFGYEGRPKEGSLPENNVLNSLDRINTFMTTALSGREKLNTLIQRLPELESYMSSDLESSELDVDKKLEYILTMEPQIRANCQLIKKMQELTPLLESDRFNNLPELSGKLNELSLKSVDLAEQANTIDTETRDLVCRYNEIIKNISKTLIAIDEEVTALEKKAEPQKVVD